MRKSLILVLMCAGGLVACDRSEPKPDSVAAAAPAQAPGGATAEVAAPTDKPVRKAGLWQITSGAQSGTLCVSNATEVSPRADAFAAIRGRRGPGGPGGPGGQGARPQGPGGDRAGRPEGERRPGGGGGPGGQGGERRGFGGGYGGPACPTRIAKTDAGWTSTASCSRAVGNKTYKLATSLTLTGDLQTGYAVKGTRSAMDIAAPVSITGIYKGACPVGMKPGDYKTADGQTRNLLQGRRGVGGAPGDSGVRPAAVPSGLSQRT